jgi:peptidyl-tRNA hydrolase
MLDLNTEFILKKDIVLRGIKNNFWALNTTVGNQYKLNEVSFYIMNQLHEQKTISQIADAATKEYKVSLVEFIEDCKLMMQTAIDNQIVEEVKI